MDIEAQRRMARSHQEHQRHVAAIRRAPLARVGLPCSAGQPAAPRRDRLADWCGQRLIGLGWRLARPGLHLAALPAVPALRSDGY